LQASSVYSISTQVPKTLLSIADLQVSFFKCPGDFATVVLDI